MCNILTQPKLYIKPELLLDPTPAKGKETKKKAAGKTTRQVTAKAKEKETEKTPMPSDLQKAIEMAEYAVDVLDLRRDVIHYPTTNNAAISLSDFIFKKNSSWMSPGLPCDVRDTFTRFSETR